MQFLETSDKHFRFLEDGMVIVVCRDTGLAYVITVNIEEAYSGLPGSRTMGISEYYLKHCLPAVLGQVTVPPRPSKGDVAKLQDEILELLEERCTP